MTAWQDGGDFAAALKADAEIAAHLTAEEIDTLFDPAFFTSQVETIFERVFGG